MSSSREIFSSNHCFDFSSLHHVPDSHAWQNLHDHPSTDGSDTVDPIPIMDLSGDDAAALLGRACEDWGVFLATGHGVPSSLLDRLDAQINRLFSLPSDRKFRAARAPGTLTGYTVAGYGLGPISSFYPKLMWSEGFTISGDPSAHAHLIWPDADESFSEFCDVMEEYNKEMKELAGRLIESMLRSLGFSDNDVKCRLPTWDYREVSAVLQLNWYPACPSPDEAIGLGPHTDSGLLAVLHQSTVPGLQVLRHRDGSARWVTVPPLPGALVVNVGDLAHVLSNGRFHSVVHRATVNKLRPRASAVYICGPLEDVKVSPLVLGRPAGGPCYRAVTWPEYRELKGRIFDKTLASIRVTEEDMDHVSSEGCIANPSWPSSGCEKIEDVDIIIDD